MTNKKDVRDVIQGEEPHLNNLLTQEDLSDFKGMVDELRDTWTKKQMFRTETEARFSVLQDNRYPTKASKYWQCVREQSSYLDNLMTLSFDYRRNEAKIKWLEGKIKKEEDEYKATKYKIDSPSKCLLLDPEDFHWMSNFSKNAVLLVLASEEFDKEDYIYEN
mgnify:CR=1 FL=1